MIYVAFLPTEGKKTYAEESEQAKRLLVNFYKKIFSKEPPEIKRAHLGKPYFVTLQSPHFSLSHSSGAIAVALCDEQFEIGIDVEGKINQEKFARISSRFPFIKKRDLSSLSGGVSFFYVSPKSDGYTFSSVEKAPFPDDENTILWTETEALLKADGDGFAGAKKLNELEKSHEVSSFVFDNFYLSIAKSKDICK